MLRKIPTIITFGVIALGSCILFLADFAEIYGTGTNLISKKDKNDIPVNISYVKGTTAGVECDCFENQPLLSYYPDTEDVDYYKSIGKNVKSYIDPEYGEIYYIDNEKFAYIDHHADVIIYPKTICIIPKDTEMIDKNYMDKGAYNYQYY